jgi:hypothetical protein
VVATGTAGKIPHLGYRRLRVKKNIEWYVRIDGGVKRTVRVSFPGKSLVKWQFKRSDQDGWDYDSPPTLDDWEILEDKLEGHYNRRRAKFETLELVRRLRIEAESL